MEIQLLSLIPEIGNILSIATAAIGLGLVIFFHELGHFAVAKWCDVNVERFSIGFGPVIWSRKWGETEYALSLIPFGGYVKMLGQDDVDPGQMSSEEVAEDPRSYTAKSVPQRMAIISAGVIMNVITGTIFFVLAFRSGVDTIAAVVGDVQVGMPAWQAGIETGDRITGMNGRRVDDFNDILRGTALSQGSISIEGIRPDGETFEVVVQPDTSGTRRRIGISPGLSLEVLPTPDPKAFPVAYPGTPAAAAGFEPGDVITHVDDAPVESYAELVDILWEHRDEALDVQVKRAPEEGDSRVTATVELAPAHFRTLGLRMDIGKIQAVRRGSPADDAGIEPGDRIAAVDELRVGQDLDPMKLPDYFGERAGEPVNLTLIREVEGSAPQDVEVTLEPRDRGSWTEPPLFPESPISIPSIGVAYHMIPTVFSVDEGSPAAEAGIRARDTIESLDFVRTDPAMVDAFQDDVFTIEIGENNWAYAFWLMQNKAASRTVRVHLKSADNEESRTVELTPQETEDWNLPTSRGLRLFTEGERRQADNLASAVTMGWNHAVNSMVDIYLTLRNLFGGQLSVKELHGPIRIATVAYEVAKSGLSQFLLFLGFLSINLAVLNFLPIPVLDGGHMVFLIWEGISRRKPSEKVLIAATYAGMAFVLGLMILVIWLDLFVSRG